MLEIRDELRAKGWKVFPERARWGGRNEPNIQPPGDDDRRWLRTSKLLVALPKGVVVIDYDEYKTEGSVSKDELVEALGFSSWKELMSSCVQYKMHDTGVSAHFAFKLPAEKDTKNIAGILTGVDIRSFGGVSIVKPEKIINFPNISELEELPKKGVDLLPDREEERFIKQGTYHLDPSKETTSYGRKAMDREFSIAAESKVGTRDESLNRSCFKVFQLVAGGEIAEADAIAGFTMAADACGWLVEEGYSALKKKISNCKAAALRSPRSAPKKDEATRVDAHVFESVPVKFLEPAKEDYEISSSIKALAADIKLCVEKRASAICSIVGYKEIHLDIDQKALSEMVDRSFWSAAKSAVCVAGDDRYVKQYKREDAFGLICRSFGDPVANRAEFTRHLKEAISRVEMNATKIEKQTKDVMNLVENEILDYLIISKQRETKTYNVNLHSKRTRIKIAGHTALVEFPYKRLTSKVAEDDIDERIIDDYKKHFNKFDEIIKFVVDSRFSSDRKKAYLWLKCQSDWGKSFLMSAFTEAGGAVQTSLAEIKKMIQGSPVGMTAESFVDSNCLMIDEFKSINSEFKQLERSITFSPKHGLSVTVPLYAKMMFSAENVDSLAGEYGVETQFSNRISFYEARGVLHNRRLFKEMGSGYYFDHVVAYIAREMNKGIEEYRRMNKDDSARIAEKGLNEFHEKNKIGNKFETFEKSMDRLAESFIQWCADTQLNRRAYLEGKYIYLKTPSKLYSDYINENEAENERITLLKKRSDIFEILEASESKTYRLSGLVKPIKGIRCLTRVPEY